MAEISFRETLDDLDEGYFADLNFAGRWRPPGLQALAAQIRAAYDNAGGDAGEEKVRPSAICKSVQPLVRYAENPEVDTWYLGIIDSSGMIRSVG
jgi:hypothetical protein